MIFYASLVMITVALTVVTMADIKANQLITKERKELMKGTCLVIIACALLECVSEIVGTVCIGPPIVQVAAKMLELAVTPFIGIGVAVSYGRPKFLRAAVVAAAVNSIFEIIAVPFSLVFYVEQSNIYHRGPLFAVYVAFFIFSILYAFASLINNIRMTHSGIYIVPQLAILLIVGGVVLLMLTGLRIVFLCISVGNLIFYISYYTLMLQVDSVTSLLNRRCYDIMLNDIGSRAVYLIFDLDKFKDVNDTYGHAVGDICLRNMASLLLSTYGSSGRCYRIGGDEFCVILNRDIDRVEELNRNFMRDLEMLRREDSRMPGASMGYAIYDNAATDMRSVIEEADEMLYISKKRA